MDSQEPSTPKKSRWKRRLLIVGLLLVAIVAVFLLALPSALSTSRATALIFTVISDWIPGTVKVDDLQLGWLSGQNITGLKISDPDGVEVVSIDRIELQDTTLWSALLGDRNFGTARILNPAVTVERSPDGVTNLDRTFGLPHPEPTPTTPTRAKATPPPTRGPGIPTDWVGTLSVQGGRITYRTPSSPPIDVRLNGHMDLRRVDDLALTIDSSFVRAGHSGSLRADVRMAKLFDVDGRPSLDRAEYDGSLIASDLPIALVDAVFGTDNVAAATIGPKLTSRVEFHGTVQQINATVQAQAEHLHADLTIQGGRQNLTVAPGSSVHLEVTPEAWRKFAAVAAPSSGLSIPDPIDVRVRFDQLRWRDPAPLPATLGLTGTIALTVSDIALDNGEGTTFGFDDITVLALARDLEEAIDVQMNTKVRVRPDGHDKPLTLGSLGSTVRLSGLIDRAGGLAPSAAVYAFEANIPDLSVETIDRFTGAGGELSGSLGQRGDLHMKGTYSQSNGTDVDIDLTTDHATAHAPIHLADGLTLRNDASANLNLTSEYSAGWLRRVHPLLDDAATSDKPISVTLTKDAFSVPLTKDVLNNAKVHATLDLGTIRFKDRGLVNSIRMALRQSGSRLPLATFTPATVRLADGMLRYDDLQMSLDNLTLGFRGSIDQTKEQLDMTMSISGQTMAKAFGLKGVIDPGYTFEIPLHGDLANPQLDTGAIAGEAARLALKSQLRRELPGPEGEAANVLLDAILGRQGKTTSPAKQDSDTPPETAKTQDAPTAQPDPLAEILGRVLRDKLAGEPSESPTAENGTTAEPNDNLDNEQGDKPKEKGKRKKGKKNKEPNGADQDEP